MSLKFHNLSKVVFILLLPLNNPFAWNTVMPDAKAKSIPQWQRQIATENTTAEQDTPLPKHALLEQAAKFLDHDDIRNASLDQKVAFLESKGLNSEDVRELLGHLPEQDASSIGSSPPKVAIPDFPHISKNLVLTSQQKTGETEYAQDSAGTSPASSPPSTSVPPIITYPEFLLHSQRPPPLISKSRVLSTIYASSATAAVIYGTSQYLLKPMLETLSVARHQLYETASKNIQTLNESLEEIVSVVPVTVAAKSGRHTDNEVDEDGESDISDPTELFHRDTGTQTSPPFSSRGSSFSVSSTEYQGSSVPTPPMSTTKLLKLHANLSAVLDSATSVSDEDDTIIHGINNLKSYLNDITYGRNALALRGELNRSNIDDELSKVKAEIRGVKGVLLSAKSFPGVAAGRGR
jgi:hypothetical protein